MAIFPRSKRLNDPDLRDRLYELLEPNHLPYSGGARFVRLIVSIIIIDVLGMILASVPQFDARFGWLFTIVKIGAVAVFGLEYLARLWSAVGHSPRKKSPAQDRIEYAVSSLGIIDLLAFLPAAIALIAGSRSTLVLLGVLPFFKLVRYSPAMRSLLAALHAERRTLFGCLVILAGAVLVFASLLYGIEHDVQPDKLGTIPQAMWWAIVTLGTVGYGDVVPVTPLGKLVSVFAIVGGLTMIALPVAIISTAFADEVRRRDFVVTWGMLARVPLFSHLSAAEIADIMRLLRAQTIEFRRDSGAARRCRVLDVFHHRGRGRDRIAQPARSAFGWHVLRGNRVAAPYQTKRHGDGDAQNETAGARCAGFPRLDRTHAHARVACAQDGEGAARGFRRSRRRRTLAGRA